MAAMVRPVAAKPETHRARPSIPWRLGSVDPGLRTLVAAREARHGEHRGRVVPVAAPGRPTVAPGQTIAAGAFAKNLAAVSVGEAGWPFWITLFWGFALAFHTLAYIVDGRQLEERTAQRYLADERRRQARRD